MTRLPHRAVKLLASEETPKATIAVTSVLGDVTTMQQRLIQWESDIPLEWHLKTAAVAYGPLPESDLEDFAVWSGPLHAYPSPDISTARNHIRALQILCGDIANGARAWLNPARYASEIDFQLTRNQVQSLVDDICYSVSFHQWGHDLGQCVRPHGQDMIAGQVN